MGFHPEIRSCAVIARQRGKKNRTRKKVHLRSSQSARTPVGRPPGPCDRNRMGRGCGSVHGPPGPSKTLRANAGRSGLSVPASTRRRDLSMSAACARAKARGRFKLRAADPAGAAPDSPASASNRLLERGAERLLQLFFFGGAGAGAGPAGGWTTPSAFARRKSGTVLPLSRWTGQ